MAFWILVLWLGLASGCTPPPSAQVVTSTPQVQEPKLSKQELFSALERAGEMELLSIDPTTLQPGEHPEGKLFMGFGVLGRTNLTGEEKARLVKAFQKGINEKTDTLRPACFEPHHGLVARVDGAEYRVIICYECLLVRARKGEKMLYILTTDSPNKVFSQAISDHNL